MKLTTAEYRIAEQIALGYSEKEIADRLCLATATVHNHTYNIRKKNDLRSNLEIAVRYVISLDAPKQFLAAILFLLINMCIIVDAKPIIRRTSRRSVITRVICKKPELC